VELECPQPIINPTLNLASHPKRILETELYWLEERRRRVRGYAGKPGHDEPHKLRESMKGWQRWVRPRAWKARMYISYNVMMSIYPAVTQIYTLGH